MQTIKIVLDAHDSVITSNRVNVSVASLATAIYVGPTGYTGYTGPQGGGANFPTTEGYGSPNYYLGGDERWHYLPSSNGLNEFLITYDGTWQFKNTNQIKSILGLGTAAYTNSTSYATAAQGTNARTPTVHGDDKHSTIYAPLTDTRFPTSNEKAALVGTGSPSSNNKYITQDYLTLPVEGYTNITVLTTDWIGNNTDIEGYPYKAFVPLGRVTQDDIVDMYVSLEESVKKNLCNINDSTDGGVFIYSKTNDEIILTKVIINQANYVVQNVLTFYNQEVTSWVNADNTISNYPYKGTLLLNNVTEYDRATITPIISDIIKNELSPICETFNGGIHVFSNSGINVTLDNIIIVKRVE